MRSIQLYLIVLLAFTCSAQYIENSFPAPSEYITGLAESGNLYAIDSLYQIVYEIDCWSGEIFDTIPLPWISCSPVGLALNADTLMFAESGSALIYAMTIDGVPIGCFDLEVHGLHDITGLSCHNSNDLFLADASSNTIYVYDLPLGSGNISEYFTLQNCPEIHDIGAGIYDAGIAVACEDTLSPVRVYYTSSSYTSLFYGDFSSAVGVGTAWEGNRFYFSDPDMGLIHRYCMDMGGIARSTSGNNRISLDFPNPVISSTEMHVNISGGGEVSAIVVDLSGRKVLRLFEGYLSDGEHLIPIPADELPCGIYLVSVFCDEEQACDILTLVR